MIYILLSVLCSTAVLVIFKLLPGFSANIRHVITLSYLFSALTGLVVFSVSVNDFWTPWSVAALAEGAAFYVMFRLMALSATRNGMAVTGLASKISVVIPLLVGVAVLGESLNQFQFVGILFGFTAVLLSVGGRRLSGQWQLPVLVFFGTGVIDASFKYLQVLGMPPEQFAEFVSTVFLFAFGVGIIHHLVLQDRAIAYPSILASMALGVVNLGTVYFLLLALASPGLASTLVYSLNSFGIVLLSAVVAILIFQEKPGRSGFLGLMCAVISIVLLYQEVK